MRRNAHSRSIMALLCGLYLLGGTPAPGATIYQLIARGTPIASPVWDPAFSLPSLNASGTVAFSAKEGFSTLFGVYAGTSSANLITYELGPPMIGREFGHPVLNDQGLVLFWRSTDDIVFGTPSQKNAIPAGLSPPFPLNSGFVGYDFARNTINNGAFSTSAATSVPNTVNWTVGTFPTSSIVNFVASGQGTPFQAGSPSINDMGNTVVYREGSTPAGVVRAAVAGSVQTLNLGPGVTQVQNPSIVGDDRVAVALTRSGNDEIVTTSALGGPVTTRVSAAVSGFTTLGRQNYPTNIAAIGIPEQMGGNVGAVALNTNGIVAFTAERPGINVRGIYAGPNPVADRVIQTGDALFGSTVVDVAFGNDGLNNSMQVAFLAKLADGTTVVARADLPGSTQLNPILPNLALPGGGFAFVDVQSGLWLDPPIVDSFLYHMTSNSLFTKILDFPTGFTSPFQVLVGNSLLGSFGPGQSVDFVEPPRPGRDRFLDPRHPSDGRRRESAGLPPASGVQHTNCQLHHDPHHRVRRPRAFRPRPDRHGRSRPGPDRPPPVAAVHPAPRPGDLTVGVGAPARSRGWPEQLGRPGDGEEREKKGVRRYLPG